MKIFGPVVIQSPLEQTPSGWSPWSWGYVQFDDLGRCHSVLFRPPSQTTQGFSSIPSPEDCQTLTLEALPTKLRLFDPSGQFHKHKIYSAQLAQDLYLFPAVSGPVAPRFLRPTQKYSPTHGTLTPNPMNAEAFGISPEEASIEAANLFSELSEPLQAAWATQYEHWKKSQETQYTGKEKQWIEERKNFHINLATIATDTSPIHRQMI